jgi:long-chain acyl-CoA synthetase
VEPQPIEDDIATSPWIKHVMIIGQGSRSLGALIVPDADALAELAATKGVDRLPSADVEALMKAEVGQRTAHRIRWEQVHAVQVLREPFSVENGAVTRTMKLRRQAIMKVYAEEVAALERRLR